MKKLITIALLACSLFTAHAATYSLLLTNNQTNLLSTTGWQISNITITEGANTFTNAVVRFYDDNSTNIVYTNAAYVTRTTVLTNVTNVITNSFGDLQTNVYPGQWTSLTTNAAATNTLPVIASFTVPANTSSSIEQNINTVKGLVATCNTTNCTVTITYSVR